MLGRRCAPVVVGLLAALLSGLLASAPLAAGSTSGGGGYVLMRSGSSVPRWNPCSTIRYQVNSARATRGALADVKAAIEQVHAATGLRFSYAGRTSLIPTGRVGARYPGGVDLVVAWTTPSRSPLLDGGEAGRGGGWWASGYRDSAGRAALERRSGFVVLDATRNSDFHPGYASGTRPSRGMLLLHELGHAMGLEHTTDRREVMYPVLSHRTARYGAGDLRGLRLLGAAQGCLRAG